MAGPHRIDVHVHAIPDPFKEASLQAGQGATISGGFPAWSPESHLAFMDRHGIATAINSISQPGAFFGDAKAATALARMLNQQAAELIAAHPTRFGAFAVLPLPVVGPALEEIAHALDDLKLDGVGLLASYGGIFLGDPRFDPVMQALDERAAVVLIHPALHPSSKQLTTEYPGFMAEFAIDTTRAVTHMVFSGVLERFPNIRFILSHAGGTIPFLSYRLSMAPLIDRARFGHRSPEWVMAQIRQFWFDTAIAAGPQNFAALDAVADPSRVLFGSDFPYCPDAVAERCISSIAATLSPERQRQVERDNALALFPRLRR
jgi:predicted TIM-barrel fold metal-dependent hydrolase